LYVATPTTNSVFCFFQKQLKKYERSNQNGTAGGGDLGSFTGLVEINIIFASQSVLRRHAQQIACFFTTYNAKLAGIHVGKEGKAHIEKHCQAFHWKQTLLLLLFLKFLRRGESLFYFVSYVWMCTSVHGQVETYSSKLLISCGWWWLHCYYPCLCFQTNE